MECTGTNSAQRCSFQVPHLPAKTAFFTNASNPSNDQSLPQPPSPLAPRPHQIGTPRTPRTTLPLRDKRNGMGIQRILSFTWLLLGLCFFHKHNLETTLFGGPAPQQVSLGPAPLAAPIVTETLRALSGP